MKSTNRRPIAALLSASIMAFVLFGSTASAYAQSRTTERVTVTRTSASKKTPARSTVVKKAPAKKVVKKAPRYDRVVVRGKVYYRHGGRYFQRVTRRGKVGYVALARQPSKRG